MPKDYSRELLLWSPKTPKRVTEQPWFNPNIPATIWLFGEKRSGKGVAVDKLVRFFRIAGFGLVYHLYSAPGFENLYYVINKNCRAKWSFTMYILKYLAQQPLSTITTQQIREFTNFEKSDKILSNYLDSMSDQRWIIRDNGRIRITELGITVAYDEPLHCDCHKPIPVMWMIPPYGDIPQNQLDAFNGFNFSSAEEYKLAYLDGLVHEILPKDTDFTQIPKPDKMKPKTELLKVRKFTLPMTNEKIYEFREDFRKMALQCRDEDRLLVNTQSAYPTDHLGKLERYTVIAESVRYIPELSQNDFVQLELDKPRSEWTNKEKSYHRIAVIANEIREFAPSVRLSGDSESAISKKAWFNFVPVSRHNKTWIVGDLQSPQDLFIGVRNQDDLQILKRNTPKRLGEDFADLIQDIRNERIKRVLHLTKNDKYKNGDFRGLDLSILRKINSELPDITKIPDNRGYIVFGTGEYVTETFDMQSWHHKSDTESFVSDSGIHYTISKGRKAVEEKEAVATPAKAAAKSKKVEHETEMREIHTMRTVEKKKWKVIIETFQQRARDVGDEDSHWFSETEKKLSKRYNYFFDDGKKELR